MKKMRKESASSNRKRGLTSAFPWQSHDSHVKCTCMQWLPYVEVAYQWEQVGKGTAIDAVDKAWDKDHLPMRLRSSQRSPRIQISTRMFCILIASFLCVLADDISRPATFQAHRSYPHQDSVRKRWDSSSSCSLCGCTYGCPVLV